MAKKMVIFENKRGVGTFSVGDAPHTRYDKKVEICVARDGITMVATFFFERFDNPKICEALNNLEMAMLEEGAEVTDIS